MDYGMLNLFSLILGLVSWTLPVISVCIAKRFDKRRWNASALSFLCCAAAILFQLMYQSYLVDIWDTSAIMDTSKTSASLSAFLLVSTIIINIICAILRHKRIK